MFFKIISIITIISSISIANNLFNKGENFKIMLWEQKTSKDPFAYGCFGYIKIDSIISIDSITIYHTRFGLPGYSWWKNIFNKIYFKSTITILDNTPDDVDLISSNFSNAQWIKGFERKDSVGEVRFLFPILPQGISYKRYDYFNIINDTVSLQYQWIDDTTAIGTFVNNRHNNCPDGKTHIYAKSAIVVRLTDENPIRIKFIQFDTTRTDLISLFIKYDFTKFISESKWYGIDIINNSSFIVEKPRFLMIPKSFLLK